MIKYFNINKMHKNFTPDNSKYSSDSELLANMNSNMMFNKMKYNSNNHN